MIKEILYKLQGNGQESWIVTEWKDASKKELLDKYLFFEDPTIEKKQDISKIDIDTLSDFDLNKLAQRIKKELSL
jgi:hypothetical protein